MFDIIIQTYAPTKTYASEDTPLYSIKIFQF